MARLMTRGPCALTHSVAPRVRSGPRSTEVTWKCSGRHEEPVNLCRSSVQTHLRAPDALKEMLPGVPLQTPASSGNGAVELKSSVCLASWAPCRLPSLRYQDFELNQLFSFECVTFKIHGGTTYPRILGLLSQSSCRYSIGKISSH